MLPTFSTGWGKAEKKRTEHPLLTGKNIALVFEKSSTRTRCAFEVAAHDQGAHVTYLGPDGSHIGREESIPDTARVLGRMFDGIEFRGFAQDTVEQLADHAGVPVWNGLTDSWHPTQMLADVLTMTEHHPGPLEQTAYCFLGDGRNNVARSLLVTGALLGMDVRIAAPRELWPPEDVIATANRLATDERRPCAGHRRRRTGCGGRRLRLHRRMGQHGRVRRAVGRPRRPAPALPGHREGLARLGQARHEVSALPARRPRPQHPTRRAPARSVRSRRRGGHRRGLRVAGARSSSTRPRTGCTPSKRSSSPPSATEAPDMRIVAALGGNALLRRGEKPDAAIQIEHVRAAAEALAPLAADHELIICHGNGPQVGMLALESENDPSLTRPYPFDALVAQTQGMIGYWLAQCLHNAGVPKPVLSVVTQTLVDAHDPAFAAPTKFVGPVYDHGHARRLAELHGWRVAADGDSWRRVVPSPEPQRIVEQDSITHLLENRAVVICGGGGGAPVVDDGTGLLQGVEAVVDKDFTRGPARRHRARRPAAGTHRRTRRDGRLRHASRRPAEPPRPGELARMRFPAGSMGPKTAACQRFVAATGRPAAIGALTDPAALLAGTVGTTITRRGIRAGANDALALTGAADQKGTSR